MFLRAGTIRRASTICRQVLPVPVADWRDPHSVSSELDPTTLNAIVTRLESRGKDPVFRSLFDTYFDYVLERCSKVLEVGAGTGVICRALAARSFSGLLVGTDQSSVFIETARKLAIGEGVSGEKLKFLVADARSLKWDVKQNDFDCLIMHTLISHVDDPLSVLKAAREVACEGASLIIVDGDYAGLSYHSSASAALSQTVSAALVTATFASPSVVRDLPSLLSASGWELESAKGTCVSEMGKEFSYWKTFAEAYMPRVIGSGLVDKDKVMAWWDEQRRLAEDGRFFAACTYYKVIAKAV
eukprot:TRINITY_DN11229_c0_g1_i2.p1 TRINITY_DN11229_c0_g1~~TRINITY_DN11229_c0_g1_i2.p1  ORF type:complete len:310 (-),score=56.22 TRINITY_DN11229_c0_g1_i2:27-926(-)